MVPEVAIGTEAADRQLDDAVGALCARLRLGDRARGPRRLLITSAVPGEGKSFLAQRVAELLARSGRRVLLVDGDLRRPALDLAVLARRAPVGLGAVLRGEVALEDAMLREVLPGLDLLPAGPVEAAPTESLQVEAVARLLARAGEHDLVVVDSPPAGLVSDAVPLAAVCDGVVLVVRMGSTPRGALGLAAERVSSTSKVLGFVINRAPVSDLAPTYEA